MPVRVDAEPTVNWVEPIETPFSSATVTESASVTAAVSPVALPLIRRVPAPPIVIGVPVATTSPANVVSLSTSSVMSPVAPEAENVPIVP